MYGRVVEKPRTEQLIYYHEAPRGQYLAVFDPARDSVPRT
jgi:hypothetical protein